MFSFLAVSRFAPARVTRRHARLLACIHPSYWPQRGTGGRHYVAGRAIIPAKTTGLFHGLALAKLKAVRAANNILASDECAWVTGGASGTTCSEHFGFDM